MCASLACSHTQALSSYTLLSLIGTPVGLFERYFGHWTAIVEVVRITRAREHAALSPQGILHKHKEHLQLNSVKPACAEELNISRRVLRRYR